ncbi:pseudouridine synthase [Flavimaricola marinus]|uniref:Pseudouridine synthase n=1 Tax=Flavimaricola marinus TaxID=1819565 RepID=A0A238LGJ2_9RHOB|nr:pseudouridine synthase [Flavimaricola marinus]SMY08728.1 Ribosomal large subunit pseudouridine synthase B [Flavimaricola marinus]
MTDKPTPDGDRIAKVLSRAGVASRRDAEKMIAEGRVAVNGKRIDSPALNVGAGDRISVDGKPIGPPDPPRLWLYHKPKGVVTTARDEMGRPTVFDALPPELPRVMSIGRLDLNSEGLLILTNDGEVKRKLELPATGWLRRYRVRINGAVSEDQLDILRRGITVEGVSYQPMEVTFDRQQGANAWLTVSLREGKNREIRRAMDALGVKVNRLIRVSYGPFQIGNLKSGEVEELKPRVVRDQLGLEDRPEPVRRRAGGKPGGKPGPKPGGKPFSGKPTGAGRRTSGITLADRADGVKTPRSAGFRSHGAKPGDTSGDSSGNRPPRSAGTKSARTHLAKRTGPGQKPRPKGES